MINVRVSKNYDLDISFEKLIEHNKTCRIDLDSEHHFETFEGILVYVSHPQGILPFSVELGVDEDGIMYEGDYGCQDSFKEIPIEEGLIILSKYRELLLAKQDLEYRLLKNNLDKNVIAKLM